MMAKQHPKLTRTSAVALHVDHPVSCHIYANEEVQVDNGAVDELLNFLSTEESIPGLFDRVAITPDFHKGSGIPIGTIATTTAILPKAIGKDVGCGVLLIQTDVPAADLQAHWPELMKRLRYIFFEGGRDIPMSPEQRELMLIAGRQGLLEGSGYNLGVGLWKYYEENVREEIEALRKCHLPNLPSPQDVSMFYDYIRGSGKQDGRDAQIGSVGGGNHFVEIQEVDEIIDGTSAYAWDLRPKHATIMVHTGSVSLGHMVELFGSIAVEQWPKGKAKPKSGFYPLYNEAPTPKFLTGNAADRYLIAMHAAMNFAECNRKFLSLMVVRALSEVLGRRVNHHTIWDAAHNFVEKHGKYFLHRKGACPATEDTPVLIPGSMGDSSFVLKGLGNTDTFDSACHGAGRQLSRGKASNTGATEKIRIVTPVDPDSSAIRSRPDILKEYRKRLAEEAPTAYKPVRPIIDTIQTASIAAPVARLKPLLTIKGR